MRERVWDFWANRYSKLWVQKYSLKPTRQKVKGMILDLGIGAGAKLLDIGCGVGELLYELGDIKGLSLHGLDFSKEMIAMSKQLNPLVTHHLKDVRDLSTITGEFDVIVCTHSLPYHSSQTNTLGDIHSLLRYNGKAIIAFASADSLLDKLILSLVKLTTGPAKYPGDGAFRDMTKGLFHIEAREKIKLKLYMPTIFVYKLRKVNDENFVD